MASSSLKKARNVHSKKKKTRAFKASQALLSIEADLYLLGEYRKVRPKDLDKLGDGAQKERKEFLKKLSAEDQQRLRKIRNTALIAKYKLANARPFLHSVYSSKLIDLNLEKGLVDAFNAADQDQLAKAKGISVGDLEKKLLKIQQNLGKEDEPHVSTHAIVLKQLVEYYAGISKRSTAEIYAFLENNPKTSMQNLRRRLVRGDFLI